MYLHICVCPQNTLQILSPQRTPQVKERPHIGYSVSIRFSSNTAITINSALVRPSLQQAQVQKFKRYVGRQGEREQLQTASGTKSSIDLCSATMFCKTQEIETKQGNQAGKNPLLQPKEVGSNNPSGLTALFQKVDYLLYLRDRQKEWSIDKSKPLPISG